MIAARYKYVLQADQTVLSSRRTSLGRFVRHDAQVGDIDFRTERFQLQGADIRQDHTDQYTDQADNRQGAGADLLDHHCKIDIPELGVMAHKAAQAGNGLPQEVNHFHAFIDDVQCAFASPAKDVFMYLCFTRALALILMMPLLCLYPHKIGIQA